MKRTMLMVVAVVSMAAGPVLAAEGTQAVAQTQSRAQLQTQAKDGTCDGTQKRLHAQDGMKQQLRTQAKAEGKGGGGHMNRGGHGR